MTDTLTCPVCGETTPLLSDPAIRLAQAQQVIDEQAEDDGLWFTARTAPEAYLQAALRRVHRVIEEGGDG